MGHRRHVLPGDAGSQPKERKRERTKLLIRKREQSSPWGDCKRCRQLCSYGDDGTLHRLHGPLGFLHLRHMLPHGRVSALYSRGVRSGEFESGAGHWSCAQERVWKYQEWPWLQAENARCENLRRPSRAARGHHCAPTGHQGTNALSSIPTTVSQLLACLKTLSLSCAVSPWKERRNWTGLHYLLIDRRAREIREIRTRQEEGM